MSQECVLVFELASPIDFTCADGTTIEKGAILKLASPMTASLANGDADYVAGIAAETKLANSGVTKIAVYRRGIFKGIAGATNVTCGFSLMTYNGTGDDNDIVDATNAGINCKTLGTALETATSNQYFLFELNPGVNTSVLA